MKRPRILDLCCCSGGAGMGYHRAGFDVVGVDLVDHSDTYPFEFHQGDALEFVRAHGREFHAVHVSPNCQANIAITMGNRGRDGWVDDHVNQIPEFRSVFAELGVPTVIENGPSKALRPDVVLCGLMFGLPTFRHRYFELGAWTATAPGHPGHRGHLTAGWRHGCKRTWEPSVCPQHGRWCRATVYGVYGKGGGKPSVVEAQRALGIDWITDIDDLNEAIPPAYTELVGRALIEHLNIASGSAA